MIEDAFYVDRKRQMEAIRDEAIFLLAKKFYKVLASTLNLQYGNVLLATSANSQLQTVLRNGWPFFANNTDLVEKCLQESICDGFQNISKNLGIVFSLDKYTC